MPSAKKPRARRRPARRRPRATAAKPRAETRVARAQGRPAAARKYQERHGPETLRLRSVAPSLTADDLARSLAFYTDVLGFIVSERFTEAGQLRGVMLKAGVCEFGVSQDDWAKGRNRSKGQGISLWCETGQDVDALAARVKAAGGRVTQEPRDQSWGIRSFSLADPDGFLLTIYRNL